MPKRNRPKENFGIIFFIFLALAARICIAEEKGCSKVYSSLVFEEKTGNILSQTRSDEAFYPASLVKVMTLYLTFEALKNHKITFNQNLTVSERGAEISRVNKYNTLHLKAGDQLSVSEAIQAVIVKSFNEAAIALAEAVAGNEWNFVIEMNKKALDLGMINTSFRNASGLHEEEQYTTSYDLARLTRAIKEDFPQYYHFFAQKEFKYHGIKYKTHNHLLLEYKGTQGMKTGFTKASGFNLITLAKRRDKTVISVLLGCSSDKKRDKFTKYLLNEAFRKLQKKQKSQIAVKLSKSFNYNDNN
jgi:D-alanyl-D-alanine carboxypeptidase